MQWLTRDLRYATRTLAKSPAFSLVAVATLALTIGAATAVFAVVKSVLLEPLRYPGAGSLVVVWEQVPRISPAPLGPNPRHFARWRERAGAFSDLTLVRHSSAGLSLPSGHPQLVGTVTCLPNFFSLLGVTPMLGRVFVPADGEAGRDGSVVLTYHVWRTLFDGDPNIVGRTVRIGDVPRDVIGVLPSGFRFANGNALRSFRSGQSASSVPEPMAFLPAVINFSDFGWDSDYGNWVALGRLAPGATAAQARLQVSAAQAEIATEAGIRSAGASPLDAVVEPLQDAIVHDTRRGLWLLMAAVGGLMLIGCVNLTNAQLGRVLGRGRETAVRVALGAPRSRVVAAVFAEMAVLTAAGSALGVLLAAIGIRLFRVTSAVDIPRLQDVRVDWQVLLFAIAVVALTLAASGLLPALAVARADPQSILQQSAGRTSTARNSRAVRTWLIGAQVAACTALLAVTGLFAQSLWHMLRQDVGFDARSVTIAEARLPAKTYPSNQSRVQFDAAVLDEIRRIPGLVSAGLVSTMPLEGEAWIESMRRADAPQQDAPLINLRWVSPGYFEALRQPVAAGRTFDERDAQQHNAVLSQAEARALFGNDDPVGREVVVQGRTFRVIGVVADAHSTSLKTAPPRVAYLHYIDRPPYSTYFVARTSQKADSLIAPMRQAIWRHAPDVTIARVTTMEMQMTHSVAAERFQTAVLAAFGASALLLAMVGIYGVLSYAVATRTQEIGLRMALGATRARIYRLAMADAGRPVTAGLALGVAASLAAQRIVLGNIYGIDGVEPAVLIGVAGLLVFSAAAAAFPAVRRAVTIDPTEALRSG